MWTGLKGLERYLKYKSEVRGPEGKKNHNHIMASIKNRSLG